MGSRRRVAASSRTGNHDKQAHRREGTSSSGCNLRVTVLSPRNAAKGTLWVKAYWNADWTIGSGKSGPAVLSRL